MREDWQKKNSWNWNWRKLPKNLRKRSNSKANKFWWIRMKSRKWILCQLPQNGTLGKKKLLVKKTLKISMKNRLLPSSRSKKLSKKNRVSSKICQCLLVSAVKCHSMCSLRPTQFEHCAIDWSSILLGSRSSLFSSHWAVWSLLTIHFTWKIPVQRLVDTTFQSMLINHSTIYSFLRWLASWLLWEYAWMRILTCVMLGIKWISLSLLQVFLIWRWKDRTLQLLRFWECSELYVHLDSWHITSVWNWLSMHWLDLLEVFQTYSWCSQWYILSLQSCLSICTKEHSSTAASTHIFYTLNLNVNMPEDSGCNMITILIVQIEVGLHSLLLQVLRDGQISSFRPSNQRQLMWVRNKDRAL